MSTAADPEARPAREGEIETLAADLVRAARAAGLWLGTVESCTGGLVAAAITEVPGASHCFERGVVTYANRAKRELVGVRAQTLEAFGAVSEPVAREMAEGLRARAPVDLVVSVTGIAGPGGSEHKPEGRVCFALAAPGQSRSWTHDFGPLGRAAVRRAAVRRALAILRAAVPAAPDDATPSD
ncbi:MAG: CinA family protein [Alphaproteobacteria bacterium]|nr:MAG: CinA family protein [Alphaproteobacteria bacterium]